MGGAREGAFGGFEYTRYNSDYSSSSFYMLFAIPEPTRLLTHMEARK
jgi:hypothetical protein